MLYMFLLFACIHKFLFIFYNSIYPHAFFFFFILGLLTYWPFNAKFLKFIFAKRYLHFQVKFLKDKMASALVIRIVSVQVICSKFCFYIWVVNAFLTSLYHDVVIGYWLTHFLLAFINKYHMMSEWLLGTLASCFIGILWIWPWLYVRVGIDKMEWLV